jgi:hypothetical protein
MSKVATTPISTLTFVPGDNLDDVKFSEQDLRDTELLIASFLYGYFPKIDFPIDGTIYELVVRPAAVEYLVNRRMSETFRQTMSIKGIQDNPLLSDSQVVAELLSNYLIKQTLGKIASGTVRVMVSASRSYNITEGTVLTTQNGLEFFVSQTVTATSSPSEGQLQLIEDADNLWSFYMPVQAVEVGTQYNVPNGEELSFDLSFPDLVLASTHNDFGGGTDGEGLSDIETRILDALSARNMVSHSSIFATLKDEFPDLVTTNALGIGDDLILRNRKTLLGNPIGGLVDVYVRTEETVTLKTVTANAVPLGDNQFQCVVSNVDAPGHYNIRSIRPAAGSYGGTYPIVSTTRSIVSPHSSNIIEEVIEGTYSKWMQTTLVIEALPEEILVPLEDDSFDVTIEVFCQPNVEEIQSLFSDKTTRVAGTDFLVRSFVPCMVTLSDILVEVSENSDLDVGTLRSQIMNYIHNIPPGEPLYIYGVVASISCLSGVEVVELPIEATGEVIAPDVSGTKVTYKSRNELAIPQNETLGYGPENTTFFIEPSQIPITIST